MPYIITTSLYPSDKVQEVGKRYLEALSKYPPNENLATPTCPSRCERNPSGNTSHGNFRGKEGETGGGLYLFGEYDVYVPQYPGF